jgi:inosose dehydratase
MLTGIGVAPSSWGVFSWRTTGGPHWGQVLDEAAAAGYDGIELGKLGFFPQDSDVLGAELVARNLSLVGGYLVWPLAKAESIEETLQTAADTCALLGGVGAKHLVVLDAIAQPPRALTAGRRDAAVPLSPNQWDAVSDGIHRIAEVATNHGLTIAFHPHAGTYVEFEDEIEHLLANTDPTAVGLCLDTGHSWYAGVDPTALYRRHEARVRYLHLKDIDLERLEDAKARELSFQDAVGEQVFCAMGRGGVDFGEFYEALTAYGYSGWATIEQDRLVETDRPAQADAQANLAYLTGIGFAGVGSQQYDAREVRRDDG